MGHRPMNVTIETDIPIPPRTAKNRWIRNILESLKAGDDIIKLNGRHITTSERNRFLRSANFAGIKIRTRKLDGVGYRIWRV